MSPANAAPVEAKKRHVILDALRGFALLGICLANFPEFSLFTFLRPESVEALPSAGIDLAAKYFIYIFIDGKFYTIFSLLFGIGFSIILENNLRRGANALLVFYRRMLWLLLIGFAHLMLLWSGDILMLYALVGMLLPLFHKAKDKTLLIWSACFLILPVIVDFICQFTRIYLSSKLVEWQGLYCDRYGIPHDDFASWLRNAGSYQDILKFLVMGAFERMSEFVDGNRYFKVAGLFLIGFWIGRHRFFARIQDFIPILKKIATYGLILGLPLSCFYAWSAIAAKPFGLGAHSVLYLFSVYITSFGYIALFTLLYIRFQHYPVWKTLALPGRMALTNYIGQSVFGILIYYGVGLGFGGSVGLFSVEWTAFAVFIAEVCLSYAWLSFFRFGPLEWIWRCLTYQRFFSILKRPERP